MGGVRTMLAGLIAMAVALGGLVSAAPAGGAADAPAGSAGSAKKKPKRCKRKAAAKQRGGQKHKRGRRDGQKHKRGRKQCRKRKRPKPKPTPPAVAPAQTADVDAVAAGAFHIQFSAQRAAGAAADQATGTFRGTLAPGGTEIGFFAGPVTCLSVVGNDIGLFYPIEESGPPGLEATGAGVFISVRVDGMGNATMAGFQPVPTSTAETCDPLMVPQLMPAEGSGTATGG